MGISTFKGGVHPYDGKDLAKDQPIRRIKPKEILVYPLSQHIGAPASPIVAVGDTVLRGRKKQISMVWKMLQVFLKSRLLKK